MPEANRVYKDRLFRFIFGKPENKEWTLSLYNAINGSDYDDPDDIEFTTLDDVVYMSMKNDVSFLVADTMSLYEQQSTFNPNMPLRFLLYAGRLYSRYEETTPHFNIYSSTQQKFPAPRCVCFYNGTAEKADRVILKLSDGMSTSGDIEVTVTMINVNYGHNSELMKACKPMAEYSEFVYNVRKYQKEGKTLSEAVGAAIDEMSDNSGIKAYLVKNRAEVEQMCITEYNEERHMEMEREEFEAKGRAEGRAEGMAKGRAEGILTTLVSLVKDGILTISDAAKRADMTVSEFEEKAGIKA